MSQTSTNIEILSLTFDEIYISRFDATKRMKAEKKMNGWD